MPQRGMGEDAPDRFQAELSFAAHGMTITAAAAGIRLSLMMKGVQPGQADRAVKFRQYAVKVVYDIVSRVVHMAGVHADAGTRGIVDQRKNVRKLLKAAADLAALARHGFEQDDRIPGIGEGAVDRVRDLTDGNFRRL